MAIKTVKCPSCQEDVIASKFCSECGAELITDDLAVMKGKGIKALAKAVADELEARKKARKDARENPPNNPPINPPKKPGMLQ